jgi:hypothetical protein
MKRRETPAVSRKHSLDLPFGLSPQTMEAWYNLFIA